MPGSLTIEILPGGYRMAAYAYHVWERIPPVIQRSCLFDVPFWKRADTLAQCFCKASHIGIATIQNGADNEQIAWAWVIPFAPYVGCCHFILNPGRSELHSEIVRSLLSRLDGSYKSLLCLVPRHYRSIRSTLAAAGFKALAILPKSCWISLQERYAAGVLLLYEAPHE